MNASLTQQYHVKEEGQSIIDRKLLNKPVIMILGYHKSPGQLCASSRGKTGGAGVIPHD